MNNLTREDIHIISRHSNWSEKSVQAALESNTYSSARTWKKFLRFFFLSLGVGFTTAGIIFFFAYNWADLNKFTKIGMMEGLVLVVTLLVLFSRFQEMVKDILLTGASVLVGVMFAVFGQIYQTGANAYDFFFGWTMAITLWVVVSNFPPLWLIYLTLINTTLLLYSEQVATGWSSIFVFTLLFILNTCALAVSVLIPKFRQNLKVPVWFSNTMALASVCIATIGIVMGIFDKHDSAFIVLMLLAFISYSGGIFYGLNVKNLLYLSVIPFSIIIILSAFMMDASHGDEGMMFFVVCIFIIASVTLLVRSLIRIQKKWKNG